MSSFGPCSCEIQVGGGCGCSPPLDTPHRGRLTLDEYQRGALSTDTTTHLDWDYYAMAIAGEAGEILEHIKKSKRDDDGELTRERRDKVLKEMGDVLWYLAVTADRLDISLSEVAQVNLDKLAARKVNGTLRGDGDER